LNFTHFKVVVVGEQPNSLLLKQVKRLRLEDTILFTGPTKTPEDFYANCDVFVLPTFYDACSLVVIEAMACGLPAITTTYNGVAGIITNEKDGYIISHPPHSEELAEAMQALMVHERLKNMSIEASITGKNYSLKKNHHKMLRVFNEIAEQKVRYLS